MNKGHKVVIQIPAYNEESTIAELVKNISRQLDNVDKVIILVLNDASQDNTAQLAKTAGADYVVSYKQNMGLGQNFKRGVEISLKLGADIIVNIDGDGQFDPNQITELIRPLIAKEAHVVIGSRFLDKNIAKNVPPLKRFGNKYFTKIISLVTGKKLTDAQCGFRAYSKEAALRINIFGKFTYTQEVLIDLIAKGLTIKELPVRVKYFKGRKSYISDNLFKYGFRSLGLIANATRDTRPVEFFGWPGMIMSSLGILGGLYSLIYWLIYSATSPVKTLLIVSIFLVTFGALLIIFGLLADMIKRVKKTQEEILYKLKKKENEDSFSD